MKNWQNSHDDKFLEELARITEENAVLKEKLAEKDRLYGSNASTPTIISSLSSTPSNQTGNSQGNQLNNQQTPPTRKVDVIRTRDLRK